MAEPVSYKSLSEHGFVRTRDGSDILTFYPSQAAGKTIICNLQYDGEVWLANGIFEYRNGRWYVMIGETKCYDIAQVAEAVKDKCGIELSKVYKIR